VIAVFVGGALGATVREYIMLMVQDPVDGFPLDILAANLVAAFLLGLVAALHSRRIVSDDINALVGTGIMGGLSTFSSFVYCWACSDCRDRECCRRGRLYRDQHCAGLHSSHHGTKARRTDARLNDPVSCRDCDARSP
jgi:hypothetical protein